MKARHESLLALLLALLLPALAWSADAHLGKTLPQWQADLSSDVRLERLLAARAIGEMAIAGREDAARILYSAIGHEDSAVRYWAVVAAGQMDDSGKAAEGLIEKALQDEAPEVRVWAAYALVRQGRVDEGVQALIRDLKNEEKGARLQAVHAIDELGADARAATEALRIAVDDEFDYVQRVARHALWVLGDRPCPYRSCEQ